MKCTPNYGKIEYPSLTVTAPNPLYPSYAGITHSDNSYEKIIQEKHLGERWLIVLIQNGIWDRDPNHQYAEFRPLQYNLYMDNYGQVWKIYLEKGAAPYQERLVYEENNSLYPLSNDLIDIAKVTMTAWLGRHSQRNEGLNHIVTPPKPFLDAFINYKGVQEEDELYARLYQSADDYEKLEKEFEIQKKRIDDLEAELLLHKKKMIK